MARVMTTAARQRRQREVDDVQNGVRRRNVEDVQDGVRRRDFDDVLDGVRALDAEARKLVLVRLLPRVQLIEMPRGVFLNFKGGIISVFISVGRMVA